MTRRQGFEVQNSACGFVVSIFFMEASAKEDLQLKSLTPVKPVSQVHISLPFRVTDHEAIKPVNSKFWAGN